MGAEEYREQARRKDHKTPKIRVNGGSRAIIDIG
jgi:hypothetical protein